MNTGNMVMNTGTIVHANPILSRVSRTRERAQIDTASYAGIAAKTTFFLAVTMLGMLAQLIVKGMLAKEPVWQTIKIYKAFTLSVSKTEVIVIAAVLVAGLIAELIGIFAQGTIPVTGTLYAASQGYFISFLVFKVLVGYEYLALEALLLTVAVVAIMSWLFASGLVTGGKKFRIVLLSLFLGSVGVGLLSFVGMLIPATRPYVQAMMANSAFVIILDVVGLVIAALFLISDFAIIEACVREGYPKKYEWAAAFGLVFTVIWIYLKILDLLMQFAGNDSKK